MKHSDIVLALVFALLHLCCSTAWSRPTTAHEAQEAVTGWLGVDEQPLGTVLGRQVAKVETYSNDDGEPIYHVVYLQPDGFVIVSADDLVEPIVGFADDGTYDPSLDNPLGALVTNDLNGRIAESRSSRSLEAPGRMEEALKSQAKWGRLTSLANSPEGGLSPMGLGAISDVRVLPLVQSRWGQKEMCLVPWYNYYTSYGYPCGCVATAMAQVMRYHEHPTSGIGVHPFTITVDGVEYTKYTRGGDGYGGPYKWSKMRFDPDCWDAGNEDEAEATGALCYDAGVSVNMKYASDGSESYVTTARYALTKTFQYRGAVIGLNGGNNIGPGLIGMVNPNLDARSPVILGITGAGGHAIVCDGYGYEDSTMYHHLNMGWECSDDAWYNLPNIDTSQGAFNCVDECAYNIRTTGSGDGEVISGRVYWYIFIGGRPIPVPIGNATVYLSTEEPPPTSMGGFDCQSTGIDVHTRTDSKGIYAFSDLDSNTTYWITAVAQGRKPSTRSVTTGDSQDEYATSGNVWGIDFPLTEQLERFCVDDDAPNDPWPDNPLFSDPYEDGSMEHPFDSIQEAIDIAIDCNEIEVAPGTYVLPIGFRGKAIHLYSSGGPGVTVIHGIGSYHVVQCVDGEGPDTILEGFTITGGNANGSWPDCHGGGMWNNLSSPTVTNCIFSGNTANAYGGGMFNHYCSPIVTNCTFNSNTANDHGGGMHNYYSNPTVTGCTFTGNNGSYDGGGIHNYCSSPIVTNCTYSGNSAMGGGGMSNWDSSPTVTNCTFISNSSNGGGGMFNQGSNSMPTVTNCIFLFNHARVLGGGMWNYEYSSPAVHNCTFSGNSLTLATYGGGGIYNEQSSTMMTNCILWGDTPDEIRNKESADHVYHSDVQGGYVGTGNINSDPFFVDSAGGNLRLRPDSPCIDKGSNAAVPSGITTDLDGHPRIIDGDCNDVEVVDMGAYEFDLSHLGDLDHNCSVNFGDISILALAWMTKQGDPNWDSVCDISHPHNDYIDWRDLAVLCDNWLAGTEPGQ